MDSKALGSAVKVRLQAVALERHSTCACWPRTKAGGTVLRRHDLEVPIDLDLEQRTLEPVIVLVTQERREAEHADGILDPPPDVLVRGTVEAIDQVPGEQAISRVREDHARLSRLLRGKDGASLPHHRFDRLQIEAIRGALPLGCTVLQLRHTRMTGIEHDQRSLGVQLPNPECQLLGAQRRVCLATVREVDKQQVSRARAMAGEVQERISAALTLLL